MMEQAFEIHATIDKAVHPEQASDLFKHMYNIQMASRAFIWDNVYSYDVTFKQLMEKHPTRNWGLIYQQGWTILLREKLQLQNSYHATMLGMSKMKQSSSMKDSNLDSQLVLMVTE